ncbi:MAG TPA: hypothetical protein VK867_09830 [Candidatus Limnocylindrales bacterium]|nr:hypothetical protein [Candidatus Limnocylindrales bacterium]
MERPTPDRPLVGVEATRPGARLSWDVPPEIANRVREHLESQGWQVVVIIGEGPRRRLQPRIDRHAG